MADREQPYDPYIPSGGQGGAQPPAGNQRTAALQAVREHQYLGHPQEGGMRSDDGKFCCLKRRRLDVCHELQKRMPGLLQQDLPTTCPQDLSLDRQPCMPFGRGASFLFGLH